MTAAVLPPVTSPGAQASPSANTGAAGRPKGGRPGDTAASDFQSFLPPLPAAPPQSTAVSTSLAPSSAETAPETPDSPGIAGQKPSAPQRAKDKEEGKGKQLLDVLCPVPVVVNPVPPTEQIAIDLVELGDGYNPAADADQISSAAEA